MGRRHYHPKQCKVCGVTVEDGAHISQKGYCPEHGEAAQLANNRQLAAHDGHYFEHWRRRCLAAFGVTLDTGD